MPKSIYLTDDQYQQIVEAAKTCRFRVSRGRGSQLALFVTRAASYARARAEQVVPFDNQVTQTVGASKENGMTDKELEALKDAIKEKMKELKELQEKYRKETGMRYMPFV